MDLMAHYGKKNPENTTLIHMSQSLLAAFNPDPDIAKVILQQQQQNDIEKAVQRWLIRLLIMPDQHMGEFLMPMITRRFQEYLEKLSRESK